MSHVASEVVTVEQLRADFATLKNWVVKWESWLFHPAHSKLGDAFASFQACFVDSRTIVRSTCSPTA
jgi:hypothetical protein